MMTKPHDELLCCWQCGKSFEGLYEIFVNKYNNRANKEAVVLEKLKKHLLQEKALLETIKKPTKNYAQAWNFCCNLISKIEQLEQESTYANT